MHPQEAFDRDCRQEVERQGGDARFLELSRAWFDASIGVKYSYHFTAFGRPIIQYPQDMIATQELIWSVRPSLIIETGIAHGGSLIMSAGLLAALDYADACKDKNWQAIGESRRRVIGVDIDIRAHNRARIEEHPFAGKIEMLQGSSVDPDVVAEIQGKVRGDDRVLVFLDSNHTHEHVLAELEAYAPLVSPDSYCVVFDTVVEDLTADKIGNRPWAKGNSPKSAVHEYLALLEKDGRRDRAGRPLKFEIDRFMDKKLLLSVAPEGYLRRLPD